MKRWLVLLLASVLAFWQAPAQSQARVFSQAELDALLAPVALYPDTVLSHILVAATYPEDLHQAAAWSRANPHLGPEQAVAAAEPMPWHPSLKALLAFPELLARMDESPQWTADLGAAFLEQEPYVMDTVQALRRRAQASGALQSTDQYSVYQDGPSIAVYPVHPQVVYLPYYNPYVVYGPWWWHSYRPVYWRPWHPRPAVHVSTHFFTSKVDWHRRHVVRHAVHPQAHFRAHKHRVEQRPIAPVTIHNHAHPARPIIQGARIPEVRRQHRSERRPVAPAIIQKHAHQAQHARPIVQGARIHPAPIAPAHRPAPVRDQRPSFAREHRPPQVREHRSPRVEGRRHEGRPAHHQQQRRN